MQFDDFVLGRCFQQLGAMSVFAPVRKQAFPGIRLGRRFAETCPYAGSQQGNGQLSTEKVPPHVLGEAAAGLAEVAAEFADEVGLADGTYQVVILPLYLQTQLDVEDERSQSDRVRLAIP